MESTNRILAIAQEMDPISLHDIQVLALMDRLDVKFILHEDAFQDALARLRDQYRILEVDGVRGGRYYTTYFDTPDYHLYHTHHDGARIRYKVRWRWYMDSGIVFLETKEKTNKDRTIKRRVEIPEPTTDLRPLPTDWIPPQFSLDPAVLQPTVWNRFRRLMLADVERRERITVDIGFHFGADGQLYDLPGLVIVEVKQRKFSLTSPMARELHNLRVKPCHISKYCVSMATIYPDLKQNRFKPLLRKLDRISGIRGGSEYSD